MGVLDTFLTNVANAIRTRRGSGGLIVGNDMPQAILNIPNPTLSPVTMPSSFSVVTGSATTQRQQAGHWQAQSGTLSGSVFQVNSSGWDINLIGGVTYICFIRAGQTANTTSGGINLSTPTQNVRFTISVGSSSSALTPNIAVDSEPPTAQLAFNARIRNGDELTFINGSNAVNMGYVNNVQACFLFKPASDIQLNMVYNFVDTGSTVYGPNMTAYIVALG